jgi:Glycosyl transferases group 1
MKILYISSFADPNPTNSNRTSVAVVSELLRLGWDVSMFTCTLDPTWKGGLPKADKCVSDVPVLETNRSGIPYFIADIPYSWTERVASQLNWNQAVSWGVEFLLKFNPNIVHLQQWQNLSWLLESAQILKIPTVYSVNDYGLTCMRTFLIKGDGESCDGSVGIQKCSKCVLSGRGRFGYLNELLVRHKLMSNLLQGINNNYLINKFRQYGVVKISSERRAELTIKRSARILENLNCTTVGSPFGASVLKKCGANNDNITILPWFHDQKNLCSEIHVRPNKLVVGFIGRISPEKGLHILLDELSEVVDSECITLKIAGGIDSKYGEKLYDKYQQKAGKHSIEWLGWLPNNELKNYYESISLTIVPSICFETGPLSMIESLAHRRPVICSDILPLRWMNETYGTGDFFVHYKKGTLAIILKKLSDNLDLIPIMSRKTNSPPNLNDYCSALGELYKKQMA